MKKNNNFLDIFINKRSKVFKVFYLSFRNFGKNKLSFRVPSLTYFTLMSIVPIFAILFAIGKFLGLKTIIEKELIERFDNQKELIGALINFTNNFIEQTKAGAIAIIGVLFLFYSLIKLFSNIESSLNLIFNAEKRKIKNRFSLYVSIIFLISLFFILFSYLKFNLIKFTEIKTFGFYENMSFFFLKLSTYFLIWVLFAFLFIYIPNIKVKFKAAVLSSFLTSLIYQIVQYYYVYFQVGFTKYNAIYGSFAALPLFLIWLQICWYIFLFGASLSNELQKIFIKNSKK